MDHDLLNARQAAKLLGVKPATIYAYVSRGTLVGQPAAARAGRRGRVYTRAEVERLRQRSRANAGEVAAAALSYGAPILDSSLTLIDPERGPLYRGHVAVDLAARGVTFEQTARLLWTGEDPFAPRAFASTNDELTPRARDRRITTNPTGVGIPPLPFSAAALGLVRSEPPAAGLEALLYALRRRGPPVVANALAELDRASTLVRRLAVALCIPLDPARAERAAAQPSVAHTALVALGLKPTETSARDVDRALVLLADHEVAPSTFAARIAASTGADLVACLQAALAVHSGPRHGGACDRIEVLLDDVERGGGNKRAAHDAMVARLDRGDEVPGFFRALYPRGDPRARAILALGSSAPTRKLIAAVEEAHAQVFDDDTPASVDAALVALCRGLRLPRGSATALFALGRCAGWIAHVFEQRQSGNVLRPRARAV